MALTKDAKRRRRSAARQLKGALNALDALRWEPCIYFRDPELLARIDRQRRRLEKELSELASLFLTSGDHTSHATHRQEDAH